MKIEEVLNSLASVVLSQHSYHGRLRMEGEEGEGEEEVGKGKGSFQVEEGGSESGSVANLDDPLAVHSRGIEAGVKWGAEGSVALRESASTLYSCRGGRCIICKDLEYRQNQINELLDILKSCNCGESPEVLGRARYFASKPGLWTAVSVIRLISRMLPDDTTSRGLEGGLWPHFLREEDKW